MLQSKWLWLFFRKMKFTRNVFFQLRTVPVTVTAKWWNETMATSAITYFFSFTEALRMRVEQQAALCLFKGANDFTSYITAQSEDKSQRSPAANQLHDIHKVGQHSFFYLFIFLKAKYLKNNVTTDPSTCSMLTLWQSLVWIFVWTCAQFTAYGGRRQGD